MPQEKSKASGVLNSISEKVSDQEAKRGQIQASAQYCPHCGKHNLAPPGSELDDAQIYNSIRKLQK